MAEAAIAECDVLVIGAGVAGLCAALAADRRRVLVVCPDLPVRSSSSALAQGGIAAPIGESDSVAAHVLDTLEAACHSADPLAVSRVIEQAASAVHYLADAGVEFDRGVRGWSLHREAGHREARVVHAAGDRTGEAIVSALWDRVCAAPHVETLGKTRVTSLLVRNGRVYGARSQNAGQERLIRARDTVLATGGLGQLYSHTTNGREATGDGLAMGLHAGASATALEFVQFHPTALKVSADPLPLLTEALRGAGARLVTAQGRAIMDGRHPMADLAPRDVVARAVFETQQRGEEVFLDTRAVFGSARGASFPGARETARRFGLDPTHDLLPVTAAAHYHMGGLRVNEAGATSLQHLWASGEVACTGLHGANRLASNSLLEAVVYGRATGAALNQSSTDSESTPEFAAEGCPADPALDPRWPRLRQAMWRCMGPVRNGADLQAGIGELRETLAGISVDNGLLRRRHALALAMMSAALERCESRGAHWRSDFPARDPRLDT